MEFYVNTAVKGKKDGVLKKHVAAIHCSTALTLVQRKISNALLFHAFPSLDKEEEHTITISQICKIIGYNSYNYELIKSSLRALMTTLIEWNIINEEHHSEDWAASTIISSVRLSDSQCTYSYSPQIKRLLSNPSVYGQINLIIQAQFKSSYGLALYENCVRYKGLSSTKWLEYILFRKLMGVEDAKYKTFRDFKKRVLDRAVLEVNTYSDINVEYELRVEKRKVTSIRFLITQKEKKKKLGNKLTVNLESLAENEKLLIEKLKQDFSLSESQSIELLHRYGDNYICEKIEIIKTSPAFLKGKIDDLRAYFISAIRNNFQPMKKNLSPPKHEFFPEKKNEKEDKEKHQKQKYAQYINENIENYYSSLDRLSQSQLLNNFLESLKSLSGGNFMISTYHKHGLSNLVIKSAFCKFIKNIVHKETLSLMTFEQFGLIEEESLA